ncbi:MAG: hypothetical protein ACLTDR_14490 [Adlercreutzia equolifaciens]
MLRRARLRRACRRPWAIPEASGIPFTDGIVKNRYVGRTFVQPTQAMRQLGIRLKLNPLPSVISSKRLVVIDDSISAWRHLEARADAARCRCGRGAPAHREPRGALRGPASTASTPIPASSSSPRT